MVAPTRVKGGNVQFDGARAGPLADEDIDLEILHGRVEDLFDHVVQPMDFIDEEDVVFFEVAEDGRQVSRPLDDRTRRWP